MGTELLAVFAATATDTIDWLSTGTNGMAALTCVIAIVAAIIVKDFAE